MSLRTSAVSAFMSVPQVPAGEVQEDVLQRAAALDHHAARRLRQHAKETLLRARRDDLAVVDDDHTVAEALGLFHVVRRVDERLAARAQRLEVVEDGVAALR